MAILQVRNQFQKIKKKENNKHKNRMQKFFKIKNINVK